MKKMGFTLVENVVAVIIVGLVITAVIFSFVSARMWVNSARHHYQAITLARHKIEDIISTGNISYEVQNELLDPLMGMFDAPITLARRGKTGIADTFANIDGLDGFITVSSIAADTIEVKVLWTEKMWTDTAASESIVMVLPSGIDAPVPVFQPIAATPLESIISTPTVTRGVPPPDFNDD